MTIKSSQKSCIKVPRIYVTLSFVCCAIADILMRLNCFSHIKRNDSKRLQMIGCACAAGVTSTFGTPFGGVLFSIEVTSVAYMVRNLPRAFLCAVMASLVYFTLGSFSFIIFMIFKFVIICYNFSSSLSF